MTDPIELLREISETQILFRHNLELDAKVCNLLAARAQAEQGMVKCRYCNLIVGHERECWNISMSKTCNRIVAQKGDE